MKIYRVGTLHEDEFIEFATCTTPQFVNRAKAQLVDGGWDQDSIEIREEESLLNVITLDNVQYRLDDPATEKIPAEDDGLENYEVTLAVDARCYLSVRAANFEDAKDKSVLKVLDADFGDLESVGVVPVNAENLDTEEFRDY